MSKDEFSAFLGASGQELLWPRIFLHAHSIPINELTLLSNSEEGVEPLLREEETDSIHPTLLTYQWSLQGLVTPVAGLFSFFPWVPDRNHEFEGLSMIVSFLKVDFWFVMETILQMADERES